MNDIRYIGYDQLVSFLRENGEKPFRAKQIWTWLWKRGAGSFDEMTDLSMALRTTLQENFTFHRAEIAEEVRSSDKTTKFLLKFSDGKLVEGADSEQGARYRVPFHANRLSAALRVLRYGHHGLPSQPALQRSH